MISDGSFFSISVLHPPHITWVRVFSSVNTCFGTNVNIYKFDVICLNLLNAETLNITFLYDIEIFLNFFVIRKSGIYDTFLNPTFTSLEDYSRDGTGGVIVTNG